MNRNDRIKRSLKENRITHDDVGMEMGKTRVNVGVHLTGKECNSVKLLMAVHKLTAANYQWLIDGTGEQYPPKAMNNIDQRRVDVQLIRDVLADEIKKLGL